MEPAYPRPNKNLFIFHLYNTPHQIHTKQNHATFISFRICYWPYHESYLHEMLIIFLISTVTSFNHNHLSKHTLSPPFLYILFYVIFHSFESITVDSNTYLRDLKALYEVKLWYFHVKFHSLYSLQYFVGGGFLTSTSTKVELNGKLVEKNIILSF